MTDQQQSSENNQWVENYLDALLSYGLSTEYANKPQAKQSSKFDAERQLYSKYYISQIMQLGEEGIHDAWSKATSTRHYGEKDARLEYLSWRVWFMKRNKERVRKEEGRRIASQLQLDDEPVQVDLDEDERVETASLASELDNKAFTSQAPLLDTPPAVAAAPKNILSESEQFLSSQAEDTRKKSDGELAKDVFENRMDGLYVCLISLHGLVRGDKMELGKDPDTGGQVKYVVELARALAQHPAVYRVDLLTRLIKDPKVDKSYGEPEECLMRSEGELGGAYIIRLPCGPQDVYLRKENLWPHLREFADRGIAHCKNMLVRLTEAHTPCELFAVHGHYADAGECAAMMASTLGVDMVMTGHSLGRNKLEHLLASGTISKTEIEKTYKISRRIEAEERGLDSAMMVFTSTQQEVDEQWGLYEGYDPQLEGVLRHRRRLGRYMPAMKVIPPGLDFSSLKVDLPEDPAIKEMEQMKPAFNARTASPHSFQANDAFGDAGSKASGGSPTANGNKHPLRGDTSFRGDTTSDPQIWEAIFRFLKNPRKPVILAMSRPDAKKNIHTLVKAFGEDETLRKLANLVLIMGNRDNIDSMASGSQKVLNQVLKLIDTYDLYGSVAYPKQHQQSDISDIYRLPLRTRGVFTNVALQEPFGLTVIEAAAHGVPTVATKNGGPVDIMQTLHSGLLVDPTNSKQIAAACLKILTHPETWDEMNTNGIKNIMAYSWPSHCKRYLESMEVEKRFLRLRNNKGRFSGSWDHRTALPSPQQAGASGAPPPISARLMSTPYPEKRPSHIKAPRPSRSPRPSKDDSELALKASDTPKGWSHSRRHFIAVQLDGAYRLKALVPVLETLVAQVQRDPSVGIGLVSMLGFEDTAKTLKEGGFDSEPFDWIICNSGADIWHALSKSDQGEAVWDADERWEEHINHRWERAPTAKMVTKLLSKAGPSHLPESSGTMGRTLLKALGDLPEYHEGNSRLHPHHIRIELDDMAKQSIDMGRKMKGPQREELSTVVVDRIRRRLRQNGFRCHITLQMVPAEGELHSHMHITPLRSSRALALRFLANKFGLDMTNFTVLTVPANVAERGEAYTISAHTSDMIELISGVCKAYIDIPAEDEAIPPTKGAADRAVLDRLSISVNPKIFANRIQFIKDKKQLADVVSEAIESAQKTSRVTLNKRPSSG